MNLQIPEFQPLDPQDVLSRYLDDRRLEWTGLALSTLADPHGNIEIDCAPFMRNDAGQWCASRWVGSFAVEGRTYQIVPRIGEELFARIAASALSAMVVSGAVPVGEARRDTLLDLLPLAWFIAFRAGTQRNGLPRAYIRREELDCLELRGTLDVEKQLTENRIQRHQLACRWDDLTVDNPINRGTRLVIEHLRRTRRFPYSSLRSNVTTELDAWRERLPLLGVRAPDVFPTERVRWSRANDGFRTAHRLALHIVQNRGISTMGDSSVQSLFIDSAEIWELYLRHRLDVVVRRNFLGFRAVWPRANTQIDTLLNWNGQSVRRLIPDFHVLRVGDQKRVLVLDAKYRQFRPLNEDIEVAQQMALYAATANLGGPDDAIPCILLYPKVSSQAGTPGMNATRDRRMGSGYFSLPHSPAIQAWSIELPVDVADERHFHESVDTQLRSILAQFLPTPSGRTDR